METPFYENGLHFSCTRCSACCRHEPGYVFLSYQDLEALITHFQIKAKEFIDQYCRTVDLGICKRLSLQEKENYDCILWTPQGCLAYEARPLQCKSYPFWEPNLDSLSSWEALKRECPGVGHGEWHSKEEIVEWLIARRNERFIDLEKDDLEWLIRDEDTVLGS